MIVNQICVFLIFDIPKRIINFSCIQPTNIIDTMAYQTDSTSLFRDVFKLPSNFTLLIVQGDTSVFGSVLSFDVEFCAINTYIRFHIFSKSRVNDGHLLGNSCLLG